MQFEDGEGGNRLTECEASHVQWINKKVREDSTGSTGNGTTPGGYFWLGLRAHNRHQETSLLSLNSKLAVKRLDAELVLADTR
ncbi:hypothetical protein L249_5411 [Ophiocordyceps polyrhachis-furcata BCC 54312]|uniref:Uncharacterized protein n=1 Tax=Ophiocordyceps polyrhachis-furcata BCC 54312 TaxID=1330021 RepID=A0A367L996_9HYPO|nr:hypothetical protein L249_5411 [Ophiocordyceps polyrhachis-furcata BCC 54312]